MNILFLLDNSFINDRRVYREAKSLVKAGFNINLIAVKSDIVPEYEEIDGIKVHRILGDDIYDIKKSSCFKSYAKTIIEKFDFNIIHANDQTMLNLGVKIKKQKKNVKLIYDSHELFHAWPLNTNAKGFIFIKTIIVRYLLKKREAKNIKEIDALITVNESIRNDIISNFNLKLSSVSIRNLPELAYNIEEKSVLRKKFNLKSDDKILVYIGANIYPKTINIEQVINEFANKPNTFMIFICAFNWGKVAIEDYASGLEVKNLFFHDYIPQHLLIKYLNDADVGIVSSWNKKDLSYWYGLDNKLFEYMMAEIPILATRQPEYIEIVEKYDIGKCINPESDNFYDTFNEIIGNRDHYLENIKKVKLFLNWEEESKKLIEFYKDLM
ncbi:MAG TPA: glycosyltransferase [Bacteroidales bacterium]|nr:glycosyltransferase [Bacteroidales bacterium]